MTHKLARVNVGTLSHSEVILDYVFFKYFIGTDEITFALQNMDEEQTTTDGTVKTLSFFLKLGRLDAAQKQLATEFGKELVKAESFFKSRKNIPYTAAKLYLTRLFEGLKTIHYEVRENNMAPPKRNDLRIQALGPNVKFHVTKTPRAGIENAFHFDFKGTQEYITSLQGDHRNLDILFTFLSDAENKAKIQKATIENIEKLLTKFKVPYTKWDASNNAIYSHDGKGILKKANYEDLVQIIKIAAFLSKRI